MNEKPLDTNEAAAFLGISAYHLRELAKDGTVKGFRIGNRGRWHFWPADLEAHRRPHNGNCIGGSCG